MSLAMKGLRFVCLIFLVSRRKRSKLKKQERDALVSIVERTKPEAAGTTDRHPHADQKEGQGSPRSVCDMICIYFLSSLSARSAVGELGGMDRCRFYSPWQVLRPPFMGSPVAYFGEAARLGIEHLYPPQRQQRGFTIRRIAFRGVSYFLFISVTYRNKHPSPSSASYQKYITRCEQQLPSNLMSAGVISWQEDPREKETRWGCWGVYYTGTHTDSGAISDHYLTSCCPS